MKKRKIFITTQYLEIGGVERSLIGLLNAIDYSRYDVDLFLYRYGGEFFSMIPDEVNLLPENKKYSVLASPMIDVLKRGHFDIVLARLFAKWKSKCYYRKLNSKKEDYSIFHYISKYTSPFLPKINSKIEYDLAIGFLAPFHILRDKVKSKHKIGWIHTDYSIIEINKKEELSVWNSCDSIASISENVTTSFLETFPSLESKIVLVENILSSAFVREQASSTDVSDEMPKEKNTINLCSVGRFSYAKNFENIPLICKKLINDGISIKWYLIGYGGEDELIKKNIVATGMQNNVIVLGKKINPYPYMQACDIYVQPSRYEGKAVTVREAQMLYKPVIITKFPTSNSQLTDGIDGVIVPMDNEGVADGIKKFVLNSELQSSIVENLKSRDYGNEKEVEKIYRLIN